MRLFLPIFLLSALAATAQRADVSLERIDGAEPRNIVFILVDDQRWDALSYMGHPFLETPHADALARGGVLFKNAYVTTSLCSPSRASILTGLYAHTHGVVDNQSPSSPELIFFSQYLQKAGYETAFVGKWHMGSKSDKPRRGWDHWVSFRGQGSYFPQTRDRYGKVTGQARINVNGVRQPQTKYITDELTDFAVEWIEDREGGSPFLLYLSHKAVHDNFSPAPRHDGRYADVDIPAMPTTKGRSADTQKPMWVKNQRNSWHGADFPFYDFMGPTENIYRRYCEALLAVDESTGRVVEALREKGLLESTLIVYMGDNGHLWGEQSLIDKRVAYEASARVPLLMYAKGWLEAGREVEEVAANIDIAPTVLEAAGLRAPGHYQGQSLLPLARGEKPEWRDYLLYEYFWERWAPMTPTMHALIGQRYKFIRPYGLWDLEELYDLETDPDELVNLINEPEYRERARELNDTLFELLAETGGSKLPLRPTSLGVPRVYRNSGRSRQAPFPREYFEDVPQ